jgi:hypothetical protein
MKKERIFLIISLILPIVFVLSLWGYYSYFSSKLNPQYDFVYVAPYNSPYLQTKDYKSLPVNLFKISENGDLSTITCSQFKDQNKDTLLVGIAGSSDDQTINNCSSASEPKNLTYYRFDIKDKTSKSISYDEVMSTKYYSGSESPDGYTVKGDIVNSPVTNSGFFNPFYAANYKFNSASLANKNGANLTIELKESPYNRLVVGWIKSK